MITAAEAQSLTDKSVIIHSPEAVEFGIKTMAGVGKDAWAQQGDITYETEKLLISAGYEVVRKTGVNNNCVWVSWKKPIEDPNDQRGVATDVQ